MSCFFCDRDRSRLTPVHSEPRRDGNVHTVGAMALVTRYDGAPLIKVDIESTASVSIGDADGDSISCDSIVADVEGSAYIEIGRAHV